MKTFFTTIILSVTFFITPLSLPAAQAAEGPAAPEAAPRFDDWIVIGPGGGGGQFYPTVSPHDENIACVRCDMTGSFVTLDGGASWRMFNLRGASDFFVFDPVNPDVIYTKNVGLYRSADKGRTWNLVHPNPDDVEKFVVSGDHGEVAIVLKDKDPEPKPEGQRVVGPAAWGSYDQVSALAVDPADSKILYASIGRGDNWGLFVSKDWGKSWQEASKLPSVGRAVYVDPKSPSESRTVYVLSLIHI